MRLSEFKHRDETSLAGLSCKLLTVKKVSSAGGSAGEVQLDAAAVKELKGCEGSIQTEGLNRYKFLAGDVIASFQLTEDREAELFSDSMAGVPYNLAYVESVDMGEGTFSLSVLKFYDCAAVSGMEIFVPNDLLDQLEEKKLIRSASGGDVADDMRENFLMEVAGDPYFAYTMGSGSLYKRYKKKKTNAAPASDSEEEKAVLKKEAEAEESLDELTRELMDMDAKECAGRKIRLYGKRYSLLVEVRRNEEYAFLCAVSLSTGLQRKIPLKLYKGDIAFSKEVTRVAEKVRQDIEMVDGYIDLWNKYADIEGDFLLDKARRIGVIKLKGKPTLAEDGIKVMPENLDEISRKLITPNDSLLFSEELPPYIEDDSMTWADYKKILGRTEFTETERSDSELMELVQAAKASGRTSKSRKIVRVDKQGYWVLDKTDGNSLPSGFITYSIDGDRQQIERREEARRMITDAESANPCLRYVIEGKKPGIQQETAKRKKHEPITAFVKEKIFEYEPRERQRKAIEIALNTPDIAIIQGPPGTGKTTVITAILERLNQMSDKRGSVGGTILVTSYQHDAVRNVVDRLSINSLPTIKYGKQGTEDTYQQEAMQRWCAEYKDKLKEKNPELKETLEEKTLNRKFNTYVVVPSERNALEFLDYAATVALDKDIADEIVAMRKMFEGRKETSVEDLLAKIRRLRTTEEGFRDDGFLMADDLLFRLENYKDTPPKTLELLEEAADWSGGEFREGFLEEMRQCRAELLLQWTPSPRPEKPQVDPDMVELHQRLQNRLRQPENEVGEILFNLVSELEVNMENVEKDLQNYNVVYAATSQQCEGRDIKEAKGVAPQPWKNEHPVYSTVVVDEAARVNPGDLMIPMAQARDRIILVGDHRQLPHIYDEEIFEAMLSSEEGGKLAGQLKRDVVKMSMFQYLKEKAEELEKQDGIKRTITLDAQYRMNPELGEFVNRNFYHPYGEAFESPLGSEKFPQSLEKKPYLWADLPYASGKEEKRGTSRVRECEAAYIVGKIIDYMGRPGGDELTYGVITFYSAQVQLIRRKLKEAGIEHLVRVGSVDAFQGMEFDVIFLSVVRTHNGSPRFNYDRLITDRPEAGASQEELERWQAYKEQTGLRHYGFLTSENRLCVSLSRQKRLLVVVGDSKIFDQGPWRELAEICIPAMQNFYEMCRREGALIHG